MDKVEKDAKEKMDELRKKRHKGDPKAERELTRQRLRKALPVLTKDQIRRYRLPYHVAILEELEERGFIHSAEFIKQLLQFQSEYRKEHSYDVIIQSRPLLKYTKNVLDEVFKALEIAETFHFSENTAGEIDTFIRLANSYAFGSADWWWLAEQLFSQCFTIIGEFREDDGFREAVCNFLFGKYLLVEKEEDEVGMMFLEVAKEISKGTLWSTTKIIRKPAKPIFIETCTLMYNCLMRQIKMVIKCDPEAALDLCMAAKKHGMDACIPRADIWNWQGKCELETAEAEKAISSFTKAFLLYKSNNQIDEACRARISLALAYLECNQWEKCHKELTKLLQFAQKNGLKNYVGLSYLYIGQYYLNQGYPENASPFLVDALNIFHEINDVVNREFVKNLAAVSKGQELFPKFVDLILSCESGSKDKRFKRMMSLMSWKNLRESFWEDVTPESTIFEEEEELIAESTERLSVCEEEQLPTIHEIEGEESQLRMEEEEAEELIETEEPEPSLSEETPMESRMGETPFNTAEEEITIPIEATEAQSYDDEITEQSAAFEGG